MPVSASRRRAGSNASRTASPHDSASPAWCTSSRITSVLNRSVRIRMRERVDRHAGVGHRDADVVLRWSCPCRPAYVGSIGMPARAAASAHCGLEVLGRRDDRDPVDDRAAPSSSAATVSANVVLPAPGVATARKSRGLLGEVLPSAAVCQARSAAPCPRRRGPGQAGRQAATAGQSAAGRPSLGRSPRRRPRLLPGVLALGADGYFSGSRLGTHTLPHSATTGVPITIASVSLSFST